MSGQTVKAQISLLLEQSDQGSSLFASIRGTSGRSGTSDRSLSSYWHFILNEHLGQFMFLSRLKCTYLTKSMNLTTY